MIRKESIFSVFVLMLCILLSANSANAQKKKKTTERFPAKLETYITFDKASAYYTKEGLNNLDSIYMIAFSKDNNRFYKMTITGYDDGEPVTEQTSSLARQRAVMVFKYFASREETEYIIKRTPSYYISSCDGQKEYYIKYKMPFDFRWINLDGNEEAVKEHEGIDLRGKVHIYVEEDAEDCLGAFYDYDYPSTDTVINGTYSKVLMPKGSIAYIHHTKDTVNMDFTAKYEEVMGFDALTSKYFLVPHKKQYIINAGYMVLTPNYKPDYSTCVNEDTAGRSIKIEVFLEKQQQAANLKFFGKTYKPDGTWQYKALKTLKRKDKETGDMWITCEIWPNQLDTVFIGKKVEEKEMSDYFYSASSEDNGSFEAMGGWLRCYKLDRNGKMVIKDKMQAVLRKP
ncbi:MAG: hypothetical protein IJ250_02215 [Bacteroidales bacterium]|nr:hypothetical protein [Bacteroidales bacterium]